MPFRGRHSPETKAKIAATLRGRRPPAEVRAKMAASHAGKPLSEEHRLACRIGHRRVKLFEPELYAARCAAQSEALRRAWAEGRHPGRRGRST